MAVELREQDEVGSVGEGQVGGGRGRVAEVHKVLVAVDGRVVQEGVVDRGVQVQVEVP